MEGPVVASFRGQAGLAMDVVRRLLTTAGMSVADEAGTNGAEEQQTHRHAANVVMLVEPLAEHWSSAQDDDVPIVLVLEKAPDESGVLNAVLAGADAVLSYESSPEEVVAALQEVSRGGSVLAPAHVRALVSFARTAVVQPTVALSRREGEILASIARGESVKQTARFLGISPKTVENLQGRLFRKLEVRNRAQAVARAHELGLLRPPSDG